MPITEQRKQKLFEVAMRRQGDFTVLLENVHDPHNISAVLRSCESVGIPEVHVLYTQNQLDAQHLKMGKRSSAGARKWVDVHYYEDVTVCVGDLRKKYLRLLGAYMDPSAQSLYSLDLTTPSVIVLGNERDGISEELLSHLDGTFYIPQMGLIQSLNISVACAVTIYEGLRQRLSSGAYDQGGNPTACSLCETYIQRHLDGYEGDVIIDHSMVRR